MPREPTSSEFTVLVLAPSGRNAEAATALLSRAGIAARPCASIAKLCEGLKEPVGAVLIEEEAAGRGEKGIVGLHRRTAAVVGSAVHCVDPQHVSCA